MKAITGFNQFINESARLAKLGLIGPTEEQKEFLDQYIGGSWRFDATSGRVDIDGSFVCDDSGLVNFMGIQFGKISGSFSCTNNYLKSLEGAPREVGGTFSCMVNELISLEHAPRKVGRDFLCATNLLENLYGCPEEVPGYFSCADNLLTDLRGAPLRVGVSFNCRNNLRLTSLNGLPIEVGFDIFVPENLEDELARMIS